MDTTSEAADLPISPLETINEANITALQLPDVTLDEISQKGPTVAQQIQTSQHAQVVHIRMSSRRKSHQMMCFACSMKRHSAKRKS